MVNANPIVRPLAVLLLLLISLGASAAEPSAVNRSTEPDRPFSRIAVIDWGLAETVVALGITPLAVADISQYRRWVRQPSLPAGVEDLGLRNQPNLERLDRLAPDLILSTPMFGADRSRLERIAPLRMFDLYTSAREPYARAVAATREIARFTGRERAGETLIDRVEHTLAAGRDALGHVDTPVYVVQFSDARHVRLFGRGSLIQAALDRLGLVNAWQGDTNVWGFANVGIETLAQHPEAHVIVIAPLVGDTAQALDDSQLWQHLPAVQRGDVHVIAPVWTFGALPSLQRFATLVQHALSEDAPDRSTKAAAS